MVVIEQGIRDTGRVIEVNKHDMWLDGTSLWQVHGGQQ